MYTPSKRQTFTTYREKKPEDPGGSKKRPQFTNDKSSKEDNDNANDNKQQTG